jgi:hypothetical protein
MQLVDGTLKGQQCKDLGGQCRHEPTRDKSLGEGTDHKVHYGLSAQVPHAGAPSRGQRRRLQQRRIVATYRGVTLLMAAGGIGTGRRGPPLAASKTSGPPSGRVEAAVAYRAWASMPAACMCLMLGVLIGHPGSVRRSRCKVTRVAAPAVA